MCYNYLDAVRNDVADYMNDFINLSDFSCREDAEEHLNEILWDFDPVTGNGSGSYTFNRFQAEENISGNWGLAAEAISEFGCSDINPFEKGAEWVDVTIRCYLLSQAISEVLDSYEENGQTWG